MIFELLLAFDLECSLFEMVLLRSFFAAISSKWHSTNLILERYVIQQTIRFKISSKCLLNSI